MTRSSAKAAAAAAACKEDEGKNADLAASYAAWLQKREEIEDRLQIISVPPLSTAKPRAAPSKRSRKRGGPRSKSPAPVEISSSTVVQAEKQQQPLIPYAPKIDVHWDFVMKELMWLGADFSGERKRQIASAKKLGASIIKFHENKEKRRLKQLQMAEANRKKLAAKLGRNVKGWWTKLEKIVSYKQKLSSDRERQASMNKQLVKLVQQTEKYTESLTKSQQARMVTTEEEDSEDDALPTDDARQRRKRRKRKKQNYNHSLTIEEALALAARRRRTKSVNYSRMKLDETEFYGESTADEGSVDGSVGSSDEEYSPPPSDDERGGPDDETTLEKAMAEEMMARSGQGAKYSADPEELRKLHEEQEMDIEAVLERLGNDEEEESEEMDIDEKDSSAKQVRFEEKTASPKPNQPREDPGEDADDDGDASDVEDYHDALDGAKMADNDDDDFHACEPEPDDETTMEAEERLGRDMTYEEEIATLNRENEMSVEELRAMYAGMNQANESTESDDETMQDEESVTSDDGDGAFEADKNEVDDETTMITEERLGRDMTYEEELDILNRENEMSVEELRAMYAGIYGNNGNEQDTSPTEEETNAESSATDDDSLNDDDDEFQADKNEVDDETTMIAEEKLGRDMTYEEEIAMLSRENEMSVEELRAMYAGMNNAGDDNVTSDDDENDDGNNLQDLASKPMDLDGSGTDEIVSASDDDGEFQVTGPPEVDDETTMIAEEKLGRDLTYEEELTMLNRENEMSIEELRAMYTGMNDTDKQESDVEDDSKEVAIKEEPETSRRKRKRGKPASETALSDTDRESKRSRDGKASESENDGVAAMKALEASAVKARETLASRPFLLAPWVKLRKYQQIGLNWLVSLQSRRLNGILADGTCCNIWDVETIFLFDFPFVSQRTQILNLPYNLQKWVWGKHCKPYPC